MNRSLATRSLLIALVFATAAAPRPRTMARSSPIAPDDSLATFSAGIGGTCLTTTKGAGYCWGDFDRNPGAVVRVIDSTGQPTQLNALSQGWFNRCGLTNADDVVCDLWLSRPHSADTATRPPCRARHCLIPLGNRGQLPPPPLRAITTGSNYACALAFGGAAYCWGRNQMRQLGIGTRVPDPGASTGEPIDTPLRVPSLLFSQISAGELVTCGITVNDRAVYCWGYGQNGETGDARVMRGCDGPVPNQNEPCSTAVPTRILPESLPGSFAGRSVQFASVSAGQRLVCAVSTTFEVYCWGGNYRCALGRCRTAESPAAHLISVPGRVIEVGAGYMHACARTAEQRVFCWGNNASGELGSLATVNAGPDGLPPDYRNAAAVYDDDADPCFRGGRCSPIPLEVSSGKRWVALAVGAAHSCALAADDGGVYCWGGDNRNLLGLGMTLVPCDNRAVQWPKTPCQPTPTRVPGLPPLGPPRSTPLERQVARTPGEPVRSPMDATRLIVNQRELRVLFPPESSSVWGWATRTGGERDAFTNPYSWRVLLMTPQGPVSLLLEVPRTDSARSFESLNALLTATRARVCQGITPCARTGRVLDDRGRVTLSLSDSALIASVFSMRPSNFSATRQQPDGGYESSTQPLQVEYVDPQIPLPDSATRARAARDRRRYDAANQWINRQLSENDALGWLRESWLEVGDSATLTLSDALCSSDMCIQSLAVRDSGWVVADSSIARVRAIGARNASPFNRVSIPQPQARVVALRAGRTTVKVVGLHGPADTVAVQRAPPRTVERTVVVIPALKGVRFSERPSVVRMGDTLRLSASAFDAANRAVSDVPVAITVAGPRNENMMFNSPMAITFTTLGERRIVARRGRHADTLAVVVLDRRIPP